MKRCPLAEQDRARRFNRLAWLGLSLLLMGSGCTPESASNGTAAGAKVVGDTTWESCYVRGDKVGYIATTVREVHAANRQLVEVDSDSQIGIRRFGDRNQINLHTTSVETPLGEVRSFSFTTEMGGKPVTVSGKVAGRLLSLETQTGSKVEKSTMVWQTDIKGFQGIEHSLEREPMQPGEIREMAVLVPLGNRVIAASAELTARNLEETKLLEGSQELLHIDCQLTLGDTKGKGLQSVIWTDKQGRSIKTFLAGIDQETFRTTREQALEPPQGMHFDLGHDTVVKVDRELPPAGETRRAVYRVEIEGDDPSELFAHTANQQVTKLGPNTAEIIVTAPQYENPSGGVASPGDSPPTPDDSSPNNMLQSDDPTIVSMAASARGDLRDPLAVARALEAYVQRTVTDKNFTQAFATALDVADSHQGDCTEHAVLLAALARASGLPARVVMGLIYVPREHGFAYHMWTEIYDGHRWLPLDATIGKGKIGAGYLALSTSNLKGAAEVATLISIVQLIGKLKIEAVEAE
jgi:Transglutaminase-like superfamily